MRKVIQEFVKLESFSGLLLFVTAILGLIAANSPLSILFTQTKLYFFINDGLMVLFFLLVGLEIKREILIGELNSRKKIALPIIAAFFGMIIPAIIFILLNYQHKDLLRGWAIPTATDIAFALGILSLLGKRIPLSVKIFLTALAIFDDLGAIIIIAVFYTASLHWIYLGLSLLLFILIYFIKPIKIKLLLGFLLWFCILQSGVHPTIAGVLLAFALPIDNNNLEHKLHPWVAYVVLPLFAFMNTGISLKDFTFSSLSLGIALGLFLGKQLGVFLSVFLASKLNLAHLPSQANYKMIYGVSLLCGVGFTMSLFIGSLAFNDPQLINTVRAGVLIGSFLSGLTGYLVLKYL